MSGNVEHIPFKVDVARIIEVLAKEIYQSPLALLRENTQNAFDALLLRKQLGDDFDPRIDIDVDTHSISIADNGIGMTPSDLREHYWHAGSSSKNTPEARAAGVVGTFGIGAMANFGIADELRVETESHGVRTLSSARRDTLSATEDSISLEDIPPTGQPGTRVTAIVNGQDVDVASAVNYIKDFVAYVDISVYVNSELGSRNSLAGAVSAPSVTPRGYNEHQIGDGLTADVELAVARTGEIWVRVHGIRRRDEPVAGEVILRQGVGSMRTFRSGFGLATVGVSSFYQFGGVANLQLLQPTAGREALTTESMQVLQSLVTSLDQFVSLKLAKRAEADVNTGFMEWIRHNSRYDLCGRLKARVEPDNQRIRLDELKTRSQQSSILVYEGSDSSIIEAVATDDTPLVVTATQNPRRQCEAQYFRQYCAIDLVQDSPTVLDEKPPSSWSIEEQGAVFRVTSILAADYFLEAAVGLGRLSHGLAIFVDPAADPLGVFLDPDASSFSMLLALYREEYDAFSSMSKDFVRNIVFPKVADYVPSSTRQGAEAFLKSVRRKRDVFEYELADLDSLSSLWSKYLEGLLSMDEAVSRSTYIVERNIQYVDSAAAQAARDVVPDVIANEEAIAPDAPLELGPAPPILRTDISSEAKLLTIEDQELPVKGYRAFIALSERTREERGDFFLQPHTTSVVWGGQKVLFVFEHHSGEFGLYYDLQTQQVVATESGGGRFPTATMVLRDRIYIPVPDAVREAFLPAADERKRFEVRFDLLFTDA